VVNRLVDTARSRSTDAAQAVGCTASTPGFPSGVYACHTRTSYDGVDRVTATQDAAAQTATASYDAAGRRTGSTTPRNDGTFTTLSTVTGYDLDGHPTDVCPPRDFTEGGVPAGSCPAASTFGTHMTYDVAGRPTTVARYRAAGSPLVTRTGYDPDGNPTVVTDPRGASAGDAQHTTSTGYDLLDRPVSTTAPRAVTNGTVTTTTTSRTFDGVGDTLAVTMPPGDNNQSRITAYSYDPDHRPVDTVTGASSPTAGAATPAQTDSPSSSVSNVRTRLGYDPDGHVTVRYTPRAFLPHSGDNSNPTANPDPRFAERVSYDPDGRPTGMWSPRYDSNDPALADPTGSPDQAAQCPAGAPNYPSSVGVCYSTLRYDADSNRVLASLPTIGGNPADPTGAVNGSNRVYRYGYTLDGLIATVDAPNPADGPRLDGQGGTSGHPYAQRNVYDADGRLTSAQEPLPGATTTSGYRATVTYYTADGLACQTISPATMPSRTTPTPTAGAPCTRPTGLGDSDHVTSRRFDAAGQLVAVTDPVGNTSTTTFTPDGLRATGADAAGNTTGWGYDPNGNPLTVLSPSAAAGQDGNTNHLPTVTNTYTLDNLLAASTTTVTFSNAQPFTQRTVGYGYDPAGRKLSAGTTETNPPQGVGTDGGTLRFTYYPDDRLKDRVGRGTDSKTGTLTSSYDPAGGLVRATDTTHSIPDVTATYYLDGLSRSTDDGTETSRYGYDGSGQPTARQQVLGGTTHSSSYAYNDAGANTTSSADLTGGTSKPWTRGYDLLGRPVTGTDPNGQILAWGYNNDDTLTTQTLTKPATATSGATTTSKWDYSYDANQRTTSQTLGGAAAPTAGTSGQPMNGTQTYSYDAANRLSVFTDTNPNANNAPRTRYTVYDADGNRVGYQDKSEAANANGPSKPCAPTTLTLCYSYNADDSLATQTVTDGSTQTVSYDADGRQTSDGCTTRSYDGFDRLTTSASTTPSKPCGSRTVIASNSDGVHYTVDNTSTSSYGYDALDRQRKRTTTDHTHVGATQDLTGNTLPGADADKTTTTTTGLSDDGLTGRETEQTDTVNTSTTTSTGTTTSPPTTTTLSYLPTAGGTPAATSSTSTSNPTPTVNYLTGDGHGTLTTSTDSSGSPTCTARFDPYGNPQRPAPTVNTNGTTNDNDQGQHVCNTGSTPSQRWYNTNRRDPDTGTYQFGARTYNPSQDAFLTSDTYRDAQPTADLSVRTDPLTANTYTYVNGDPENNTDPTGHGGTCDARCDEGDIRGGGIPIASQAQAHQQNDRAAAVVNAGRARNRAEAAVKQVRIDLYARYLYEYQSGGIPSVYGDDGAILVGIHNPQLAAFILGPDRFYLAGLRVGYTNTAIKAFEAASDNLSTATTTFLEVASLVPGVSGAGLGLKALTHLALRKLATESALTVAEGAANSGGGCVTLLPIVSGRVSRRGFSSCVVAGAGR